MGLFSLGGMIIAADLSGLICNLLASHLTNILFETKIFGLIHILVLKILAKILTHQAIVKFGNFVNFQDLHSSGSPRVTSQRDDHLIK